MQNGNDNTFLILGTLLTLLGLLLYVGFTMKSEQVVPVGNAGYFGIVTSSVNWCELDYDITYYIAEFWNTLSSLAMVFVGGIGVCLHYGVLEKRFLLAFFFVAVLGVGSCLFHATLKHEGQMADELPMLYAAMTTAYILIENEKKSKYRVLVPVFVGWAIVTSGLTFFSEGLMQFILFHLSFSSAEFFSLYRVYVVYSTRTGDSRSNDAEKAMVRNLFMRGFFSYVLGMFVWYIDLSNCDFVQGYWPEVSGLPNPQLHAWWHVLVSSGFLHLIVLIAYDRQLTLKTKPSVTFLWSCIPYVHVENMILLDDRIKL